MGKYIKKSKIAGDVVAVMEVSPHSSLGVRTRARTLALQTLHKSEDDDSSFSYLQLRNRRLAKLAVVGNKKPQPQPPPVPVSEKCCGKNPSDNFCCVIANSMVREQEGLCVGEITKGCEAEENVDVCIEGSFGENFLEVEGRERSTRESTPCSLIRDSNTISTPGSTTRQRTSNTSNQIIHGHMQRNIPTAFEMDEFFAFAEKQQQRIFMDKYNFDIVNDIPLPGRYEWVQVLH